jgi:hypothetical protein
VIGVSDKRTDNSGKAISMGTAPIRVAAGWTYQAHFAGDSLYEKKDSAIKTYYTVQSSGHLTKVLPNITSELPKLEQCQPDYMQESNPDGPALKQKLFSYLCIF